MPRRAAKSRASSSEPDDEKRLGIQMPCTASGPARSPPTWRPGTVQLDNPNTTDSCPVFRTYPEIPHAMHQFIQRVRLSVAFPIVPVQNRHARLPTGVKWVSEPLGSATITWPSKSNSSRAPNWFNTASALVRRATFNRSRRFRLPTDKGLAEQQNQFSIDLGEWIMHVPGNSGVSTMPEIFTAQNRNGLPSRSKWRTSSSESNQRSSSKTS